MGMEILTHVDKYVWVYIGLDSATVKNARENAPIFANVELVPVFFGPIYIRSRWHLSSTWC